MVDNSYAVLILGAGASKEYNLPLGSELKDKIARLLDFRFEHSNRPSKGDNLVFDAIGTHQQDFPRQVEVVNKLIIAGREIIDALPQAPSIDQFIFNRSSQTDIATIGKIAIARAIQQAERESKLNVFGEGRYASPEKGFKDWKISDTWLPRLFSIIVDGCASFEELEVRLKKIKVISFNYDRVFLHFLYHALNNYYPGKSNEIGSALCALDVIRPYGSIGPLNWENERDGVHYGGNLDGLTLALLASKILPLTKA